MMRPAIGITRRKIALAVALLIMASLLLFIYNPWSTESTHEEESIDRFLAELFVKTILALNKTTDDLSSTYYGLPSTQNISIDEILDLQKKYKNISDILFPFPFSQAGETPIEKTLLSAFENYYGLTNTSIEILNASNTLQEIMPTIKSSLQLLAQCRVEEAVSEYREIKTRVYQVRSELLSAYTTLLATNDSALLSSTHRLVKEKALNTTSKVLSALNKYIELFSVAEAYPDEVKNICLYSNGTLQGISIQELQLLKKLVETMKNTNDMGQATDSMNAVNSMIQNAYWRSQSNTGNQNRPGCDQGSNRIGNQNNQQGLSGSGAGYYNITETD